MRMCKICVEVVVCCPSWALPATERRSKPASSLARAPFQHALVKTGLAHGAVLEEIDGTICVLLGHGAVPGPAGVFRPNFRAKKLGSGDLQEMQGVCTCVGACGRGSFGRRPLRAMRVAQRLCHSRIEGLCHSASGTPIWPLQLRIAIIARPSTSLPAGLQRSRSRVHMPRAHTAAPHLVVQRHRRHVVFKRQLCTAVWCAEGEVVGCEAEARLHGASAQAQQQQQGGVRRRRQAAVARQGHGPGRVRLRRRGWGETLWHDLRNGLGSRDCETGRRVGADPHRAGYQGAASPAPESSFQALGRNSAQGRRVRCRTQRLAEGRLCAGWQQDCERLQRYVSGMASGLVLLGFSAAPHVRRPHPRNGGRQVAADGCWMECTSPQ